VSAASFPDNPKFGFGPSSPIPSFFGERDRDFSLVGRILARLSTRSLSLRECDIGERDLERRLGERVGEVVRKYFLAGERDIERLLDNRAGENRSCLL